MTDRLEAIETNPLGSRSATLQGRQTLTVTLVIPCYNEAQRLDLNQVDEFLTSHPEARIIFVDDKSTDSTLEVLRNYCAGRPETCLVIPLPKNTGKAEAVRRGITMAFDSGTALVGYWDADLAAPLHCVDELVDELETDPHVRAVLGSRIRMLGRQIDRKTSRHYLGRAFATIVSLMLGIPVYDTQCGSKIFRNDPTVAAAFEHPFVSRWIFDVEILARLMNSPGIDRTNFGVFVRERPLSVWRDVSGSKLKAGNFLEAALDLVRIWRKGMP